MFSENTYEAAAAAAAAINKTVPGRATQPVQFTYVQSSNKNVNYF
jgi:hypothetical protein